MLGFVSDGCFLVLHLNIALTVTNLYCFANNIGRD